MYKTAPKPEAVECHSLHGPNDLGITWTGPKLEEGRLPAFFYFSLSAQDSLCLDPFNQPVAFLKGEPIRVFSMTLPAHGDSYDKMKAIEAWADAYRKGEDPLESFLVQAEENVRYLIGQGLIDTQALATGGLSRGGLLASLLAVRIHEVNTVLAFAPVTDLLKLRSFQGMDPSSAAGKKDLKRFAEVLVNKNIRFYMTNRDVRVNTDACFECIRAIAEIAHKKRQRKTSADLILSKAVGQDGHGTVPEVFYDGAQWLKMHLMQRSY